MSWNYRLCKSTYTDPKLGYVEYGYDIREVYYNSNGSIWAITENSVGPYGADVTEVADVMDKMSMALTKAVIDLDTVSFSPRDPQES